MGPAALRRSFDRFVPGQTVLDNFGLAAEKATSFFGDITR